MHIENEKNALPIMLAIIGFLLVVAAITGEVESQYLNIGLDSTVERIACGLLGILSFIFSFKPPRLLVASFFRSSKVVEIPAFEVRTEEDGAGFLAMKVQKNLRELLLNKGKRVVTKQTTESKNMVNAHPFRLSGTVDEVGGLANIDVVLTKSNGEDVSSTSISGSFPDLKKKYKVIPDAIIYGLDVNLETLKKRQRHPEKRPTDSIKAFADYKWALRKYREAKYEEAVLALEEAVSQDPQFAMAYWTGGEILRQIGQTEDSDRWGKKAFDLDKDHQRWAYAPEGNQGNPVPHLLDELRRTKEAKISEGMFVREVLCKELELEVVAVRLNPDHFRFRVSRQKSIYGNSVKEYLEEEGAILAINGGMYESDYKERLSPAGLFIVNGTKHEEMSDRLSGAFVVTKVGRPAILSTKQLQPPEEYAYALQSRPLLVDPGGEFGIHSNEYDRMNRSAVGMAGDELIFLLVRGSRGTGLSLYELAKLLHVRKIDGGFGCSVALNLDGGPFSQLAIDVGTTKKIIPGLWNVHNAIAVLPK